MKQTVGAEKLQQYGNWRKRNKYLDKAIRAVVKDVSTHNIDRFFNDKEGSYQFSDGLLAVGQSLTKAEIKSQINLKTNHAVIGKMTNGFISGAVNGLYAGRGTSDVMSSGINGSYKFYYV